MCCGFHCFSFKESLYVEIFLLIEITFRVVFFCFWRRMGHLIYDGSTCTRNEFFICLTHVTDCLEHVEQVPGRLIIMRKKKKPISSETIGKINFQSAYR